MLRRPTEADRRALAAFAAALQERADHHVAYLGTDPDGIAAEMVEDVVDWTEAAAVAEESGRIVGWLMGSIDHDMGRVWWFGPFVDSDDPTEWAETADRLDEQARAGLAGHVAGHVTEEEYAFDARHVAGARWATGHGFTADPGSAVLTLDHVLEPEPTTTVDPSIDTIVHTSVDMSLVTSGPFVVRPVEAADAVTADTVARLHDELFANTHTRGVALVASTDPNRPRLVAESDGVLAGYVAVERQPDGAGYIDYLGVAPAFRRRGIGAALVRAGVVALADLGCPRFHLTVREANAGARALYTGLGFTEERVIRPFRRGFSLP